MSSVHEHFPEQNSRENRKQEIRERPSLHKKRWTCVSCGWIGILVTRPCRGCGQTLEEKKSKGGEVID